MQHKLYGLRGKAYANKVKHLNSVLKPEIKSWVENRVKKGSFTPKDLGELAIEFRLPMTFLDKYLSELTDGILSNGLWTYLSDNGMKARDIGVIWNNDL